MLHHILTFVIGGVLVSFEQSQVFSYIYPGGIRINPRNLRISSTATRWSQIFDLMRSHAAQCFGFFWTKFLIRLHSLVSDYKLSLKSIPLDGLWLSLLDKMTVVAVLVILLEKYEGLEAQEVRWTTGMWKKHISTMCYTDLWRRKWR